VIRPRIAAPPSPAEPDELPPLEPPSLQSPRPPAAQATETSSPTPAISEVSKQPEESIHAHPANVPPKAPSPEPKVSPKPKPRAVAAREPTYVYEVNADEISPPDVEPAFEEPEDAFKPLEPEELGPLEDIEDEALMFEVPATPRAASHANRRARNVAGKPPGRNRES
jgi:hypothetical protein